MCRNIRVLHNFAPPTTPEEIRAAALQFVRKVSGAPKPTAATESAFNQAVDEVAATTARLLAALPRPRTAANPRRRARTSPEAVGPPRDVKVRDGRSPRPT